LSDLELKIKLLELLVEALRSVLSEWDADKSCYTQMRKADAIQEVLWSLK
jgi:hypothetical protein